MVVDAILEASITFGIRARLTLQHDRATVREDQPVPDEKDAALPEADAGIILTDDAGKRVVNSLFLWDWKGWDDNLWNNIEGFTTANGQRKTPLSDHLLDLFSEWGAAFLGVPTDSALLFDRFEALGALVHLEENSESSLKDQLEKGDGKARMSVGRLGWRSEGRRSIEHELKSTATRQQMLKAGFAFGSEAYLDLFLENLSRIARWMEWR